jgi:hypothetical protein
MVTHHLAACGSGPSPEREQDPTPDTGLRRPSDLLELAHDEFDCRLVKPLQRSFANADIRKLRDAAHCRKMGFELSYDTSQDVFRAEIELQRH